MTTFTLQYTSQNVSFSVSDNKVEELENLLIFKICHKRRDVGPGLLKYTLIKEVEVMRWRQEDLS
jgi:hypothetical protein